VAVDQIAVLVNRLGLKEERAWLDKILLIPLP
jgi:hypothetical protein